MTITQLEKSADVTVRKRWHYTSIRSMKIYVNLFINYVISRDLMESGKDVPSDPLEQCKLMLDKRAETIEKLVKGSYEALKETSFWVTFLHFHAINGSGRTRQYKTFSRVFDFQGPRKQTESKSDNIDASNGIADFDDVYQVVSQSQRRNGDEIRDEELDDIICNLNSNQSPTLGIDNICFQDQANAPGEQTATEKERNQEQGLEEMVKKMKYDDIKFAQDISSDLATPEEDLNPLCLKTIMKVFHACYSYLEGLGHALDKVLKKQVVQVSRRQSSYQSNLLTSLLPYCRLSPTMQLSRNGIPLGTWKRNGLLANKE